MPKLTRALFTDAIDSMWGLAQETLARTGTVYATLIGFDTKSQQTFFIQVPAPDPAFEKAGAIAVTTPFSENLDLIRDTFQRNRVVAAVLYCEAWSGTDAAARDVFTMGLAPHEHPMKDELLLAVGFWPREYVAHGHRALISRGERGEMAGLVDQHTLSGETSHLILGWLPRVLPQPY